MPGVGTARREQGWRRWGAEMRAPTEGHRRSSDTAWHSSGRAHQPSAAWGARLAAAVRAAFWVVVLTVMGCGARGAPPAPEPYRASDAAAAHAAYQAYCGLCPKAETCCLSESDFGPGHWSSASGAYLRAMRGYYECQRAQTMGESLYVRPPEETPGAGPFGPFTNAGHYRLSCYPHACEESEVMASELDRARADPVPHDEGAVVICSPASGALTSKP